MSNLSGLSTFKYKQRQTSTEARVQLFIKPCQRNATNQCESKAKAGQVVTEQARSWTKSSKKTRFLNKAKGMSD